MPSNLGPNLGPRSGLPGILNRFAGGGHRFAVLALCSQALLVQLVGNVRLDAVENNLAKDFRRQRVQLIGLLPVSVLGEEPWRAAVRFLRDFPARSAAGRLLEADNSPDPVKKAEPRKADNCGHCGKPLATLRSAASRYCDRYCAKGGSEGTSERRCTVPLVAFG
jgi:hypothetical protein